jgi:hypothetical protein
MCTDISLVALVKQAIHNGKLGNVNRLPLPLCLTRRAARGLKLMNRLLSIPIHQNVILLAHKGTTCAQFILGSTSCLRANTVRQDCDLVEGGVFGASKVVAEDGGKPLGPYSSP